MSYSISVSVIIHRPVAEVFVALCHLDNYTLWNGKTTRVSKSGYLAEDMIFEIDSIINNEAVTSRLEVVRIEPNTSIEMINNSRVVSYRIMYHLISEAEGETEVACMLQFEFKSLSLDLARPAVEEIAKARIQGNLNALKELMESTPIAKTELKTTSGHEPSTIPNLN